MRAVIQRVIQASVQIATANRATIQNGLLILAGIEAADTNEDIDWLCNKIVNMRIFSDEAGLMNLSIKDTDGEILLVSQFTLHASTKKGNRPSFIQAAKPVTAIPLYEKLITVLETNLGKPIKTGVFGADMQVHLVNDGPVTIWVDSKRRE